MKYSELEFPKIYLDFSDVDFIDNLVEELRQINLNTIILNSYLAKKNSLSDDDLLLYEKVPYKKDYKNVSNIPKMFHFNVGVFDNFSCVSKLLDQSDSEMDIINLDIDISLKKREIQRCFDFLKKKGKVVICNPVLNSINEISNYNRVIEYICEANSKLILLSSNHWKTALIKKHPCNLGLCNGEFCHTNKSGLPKELCIDSKYNLYAWGEIYLGNINLREKSLLEMLVSTRNKYESIYKNVYEKYIFDYNYPYFPWESLLKMEGL